MNSKVAWSQAKGKRNFTGMARSGSEGVPTHAQVVGGYCVGSCILHLKKARHTKATNKKGLGDSLREAEQGPQGEVSLCTLFCCSVWMAIGPVWLVVVHCHNSRVVNAANSGWRLAVDKVKACRNETTSA
jgi:hypothetical protein